VNYSEIRPLLETLKQEDEDLRDDATSKLWRLWFEQKGELGLEILRRVQAFMEAGDTVKAEQMLTDTIRAYPDFAEAWNRRAVLSYIQGDYNKSRLDCEQVVKLNPYHFGAWHGLGLCEANLGHYREAIRAFQQALAIQPHALVNQRLILECTALLQ
jgi:tetratricopeptide (TPR) repeat protein